MSYQVEFEPEAIADLDRMAASTRERILRKINWFALNFDSMTPEALKGELSSFFKLRVGDYRVILRSRSHQSNSRHYSSRASQRNLRPVTPLPAGDTLKNCCAIASD